MKKGTWLTPNALGQDLIAMRLSDLQLDYTIIGATRQSKFLDGHVRSPNPAVQMPLNPDPIFVTILK